MGAHFGTPTDRASSGTEEEFNRALERHQTSPGSIEIMMYFKDVGVHRDRESLLQALKIEEFRERVERAGVFYKVFKDTEQFAKLLDVDLLLCLRDRFSKRTPEGQKAVAALPTVENRLITESNQPLEEDLGYLDYLELFEDSMERLGSLSSNISDEIEKFNKRVQTRTEELKACKLSNGKVDIRKAKIVGNKAAGDYDELATTISHYVGMQSRESRVAADALHGVLALAATLSSRARTKRTKSQET